MKYALIVLAAVVVLLILGAMSGVLYTIQETEQVIITEFGKPVGEAITEPGLHVKWPFVRTANYFDKRFLEWDGAPNQITTKDKRFIYVDTYARWQIADPLLFFQRLRNEAGAQSRLDDILDGETRNTVAKHALIEVVRSSDREFAAGQELVEGEVAAEPMERFELGRSKLAAEVLASASARIEDLGIRLLDFRFKRIGYVEEVQREVFARMISERNRIAEQFRSEGAGEAARINGDRDRELKVITSAAYREAQGIKGIADAKAADIYAAAYNADPDFYRFVKTMETYRETMDAGTIVVLTTDGEFYRYLNHSK